MTSKEKLQFITDNFDLLQKEEQKELVNHLDDMLEGLRGTSLFELPNSWRLVS